MTLILNSTQNDEEPSLFTIDMVRTILLYLFIGCCCKLTAQNGCKDSVFFTKYQENRNYAVRSDSKPIVSPSNNIYQVGVGSDVLNFYASITKFDSLNNIIFHKSSKLKDVTWQEGYFTKFNGFDKNENLYVGGDVGILPNVISKYDSSGNCIWTNVITKIGMPNLFDYFAPSNNATDGNGNRYYLFTTLFSADNSFSIVKVDGLGNYVWTKKIDYTADPNYSFNGAYGPIVISDTEVVIATGFGYNAPYGNSNYKEAIQLIKLHTVSGNIINQKTIQYYNSPAKTTITASGITQFNYNPVNKTYSFVGFNGSLCPIPTSQHCYIITNLDSAFTIQNVKGYYSEVNRAVVVTQDWIYSANNEPTLTYNCITNDVPPQNFLYYATLNNKLQITGQQRNNLFNIGFPNRSQFAPNTTIHRERDGLLSFKFNNDYGYTGPHTTPPNSPIYFLNNSPFYNTTNNCNGYDTTFLKPYPIYGFNEPVVQFTVSTGVPFITMPLNCPGEVYNWPMAKTELCKQISICDTIKLNGTGAIHCTSSPIDSFKLYKNPLCLRKTNWQVDTTVIKILHKTDTTLKVQYLQNFSGYVKVGFEGCTLVDSVPIQVVTPKTSLNLGNDTMQCPGKSITLHAGQGFKSYKWNRGDTTESITINSNGSYSVVAIDSCGTIFKDTLIIYPLDTQLDITAPNPICLNDTAIFPLSTKLYNYTWQPNNGTVSLKNGRLYIYPKNTTLYTITALRLVNCALSDTALIKINTDCSVYIYFPNAFTPNNDGLNDTYSPKTKGVLVQYEFTIFNRYGQVVFTTKTPGNGWNGIFKNSNKVLPGSYVYTCTYQFLRKAKEVENGSFILLK